MFDIEKIMENNRWIKSLTGVSKEEFLGIEARFEDCHIEYCKKINKKYNFGRPHTLNNTRMKVFFILFYVKCYPTFDMASFIFGADRSQVCRWAHEYLEVLEIILDKEIVLPERKISNPADFFTMFPGVNEVWIDGTERPRRRPKDKKKQKEHYSGKKKRHTDKNIVISDKQRRVLVLTDTVAGSKHDYKHFKESGIGDGLPDNIDNWLDSGFQGIKKDYPRLKVKIPKRASRNHPLSSEEKKKNREISQVRILVENALCGVKRLRSLTDVFRNIKENFSDKLILVGCGIWNYHLKLN